jgi:hypothetical protein
MTIYFFMYMKIKDIKHNIYLNHNLFFVYIFFREPSKDYSYQV